MKYVAPILLILSMAFACFTDPQGVFGILVARDQVVAILHATDCASGARTKIVTMSGNLCVMETPQEVEKRLEAVK